MSSGRAGAIALIFWMLACAGSLALAQGPQTTTSGPAQNAVPASYVVGPNDVLAMSVFDDPELNDAQMRVDQDGTVRTPYGKTPVHVAGLRTPAIEQAIAAELVKDQLAVDPNVEVYVVDPESHPIVITGQGVRQPGTIQAVQPIRLLDAITDAGGINTSDGATITIIRTGANGAQQIQTLTASQVLTSGNDAFNPWLRGGEAVRVIPGGDAYLSGAVMLPGAYPLSDSDPLTVRKLMAKAHGLGPAAKAKQTQLIHHVGQPNQTETVINLPGIIAGTSPDITLAADDMVYVPLSGGKKAAEDTLSRAATIVTIAIGSILGTL